eukprot:jgi/Tetstr1/464238/TSEL_009043.t1
MDPDAELALMLTSRATAVAWTAREHQRLARALRLVTRGLARELDVSQVVREWRPSRRATRIPSDWALRLRRARVVDLTAVGRRLAPADAFRLTAFSGLTALNLCGSVFPGLSPDALTSDSITDLNVAYLTIRGDASWLEVLAARMPRLEALDITSCRPVPRMPAPLPAGWRRLEAGVMSGASGIRPGPECRLEHLSLRARLSLERDLASGTLAAVTTIRTLDLSSCGGNVSIVGLHRLPALETLLLRCRKLRETDVAVLARCSRLKRLDLSFCGATSSLESGLSGMPALTDLNLSGAAADPMRLMGNSLAPGLTSLDLSACAGLAGPIEGLEAYPRLTRLDLSDCPGLDADAARASLRRLPGLRTLYLSCRMVPEEPAHAHVPV